MNLTLSKAAVLLAVYISAAKALGNQIDDLKCKLPGWPGHPAPSCDPTLPKQCCPGTDCLPDPFDPSHSTCQQTNTFSLAQSAATASVLTNHAKTVLSDAVARLNLASTSLYLAENVQEALDDKVILARAKSLVESHGNIHTHKGGEDEDPAWLKGSKGSRGRNRKNVPSKQPTSNAQKQSGNDGQGDNQGGGFDYSQYYPGSSSQGASNKDGASQQGGFDYQKYLPKSIPNNNNNDEDKKANKDEKKVKTGHQAEDVNGKAKEPRNPAQGVHHNPDTPSNDEKEHGGYDYAPSYQYGGDPHKKGLTRTFAPVKDENNNRNQNQGGQGGQGGFDYSQYWPMPNRKSVQQADGEGTPDPDFMQRAAIALLELAAQARKASAEGRKDVLEGARIITRRLLDQIDRELQSTVNDNPAPKTNNVATGSPTLVWNDPRDPWSKYIPNLPGKYQPDSESNGDGGEGKPPYNTGDRRPGSLGGPCGQTPYHDFGPCQGDELVCEGLEGQRPGLCKLRTKEAIILSRQAALDSLRLAQEATMAVHAAAVEILVASSKQVQEEQSSTNDLTLSLNESTIDVREYSPMTVAVVLLGFAVLCYFCWMNSMGKRRNYQPLDSRA